MIKVYLKGENNTCVGVINECDSLIYDANSFVKQESVGDYKASELQIVDGVVSVDTVGIESRRKESLRQTYKSEYAEKLSNATVEVDDMIFQSRPSDLANFQIGITDSKTKWGLNGNTKWRLKENGAPTIVTTNQLKEAMLKGIALAVQHDDEYNAKLEELYS